MEKILVQESDTDLLNTIKTALEFDNFEVHTVLDIDSDFLELIHQFRPHVVLLDYKLKGEACMEICSRIKEKYPHLPVIALSCNNNIHTEYDRRGFDDYIPKPFDLDLLYSILRKHILKAEV